MNPSIISYAINEIKDLQPNVVFGCDLHNEIFNTDYFIVGSYRAEQWLIENGGVFNAISVIQEYEEENFGKVYTDLSSSENLVNMFVYVLGDELLQKTSLNKFWDRKLNEEDITILIEELENL